MFSDGNTLLSKLPFSIVLSYNVSLKYRPTRPILHMSYFLNAGNDAKSCDVLEFYRVMYALILQHYQHFNCCRTP